MYDVHSRVNSGQTNPPFGGSVFQTPAPPGVAATTPKATWIFQLCHISAFSSKKYLAQVRQAFGIAGRYELLRQ